MPVTPGTPYGMGSPALDPYTYMMGLMNTPSATESGSVPVSPGLISPYPVGALPVGPLPVGPVRSGTAAGLHSPQTTAGFAAGLEILAGSEATGYGNQPEAPGHHYSDADKPPGLLVSKRREDRTSQGESMDMDASRVDETMATTLIVRNLPASFDQGSAQEWLDEQGYSGKYDFFLWFPAKSTSRLNSCGYAFVNFRTAADAYHCSKTLHLTRFPLHPPDNDAESENLPLSVAVAKVQGFAENYARFQHLLEGTTPTRCSPFFARDSIEALSQAELTAAAANIAPFQMPSSPDFAGPVTTVVIRNLPSMIESTDRAREWLDAEGFGRQYDFLLYLPAKRKRPIHGKTIPLQGYGYTFVNFKKSEDAEKCIVKLNGKIFGDGTPPLNIVSAKVQGNEKCVEHFSSLTETGRCTPWFESQVAAPRPTTAPRTVFQ